MSANLDITAYDDHLHFLRDIMKVKKERNPSFSIEVFARQLNLKNKSVLAMCMTGARFPNQQLVEKLSDYLGLNDQQKHYFHRLIMAKKLQKEGAHAEVIRDVLRKEMRLPRTLLIHDQRLEELRERLETIENQIAQDFHDLNGELKVAIRIEFKEIT